MRDYVRTIHKIAARNSGGDDLERQVSQCSGLVKMMCGVANNSAFAVVCHAWSLIADIRDEESYEEKKSIRELAEMREDARKDREEIKQQMRYGKDKG